MVSLNSLVKFLFFLSYSFFFLFLFPLFLFDLLLQFLLHLHSLLLLFPLDYVFFIPSSKNRALFLKGNIETTLCNSTARHYCREVLLSLTRWICKWSILLVCRRVLWGLLLWLSLRHTFGYVLNNHGATSEPICGHLAVQHLVKLLVLSLFFLVCWLR